MKIFEIITEKKRNDELIQQVKDFWDSGMRSPKDIAAKLNIGVDKVYNILRIYYSNRPGKQEQEKNTNEFIQQVKDLWDSGIRSAKTIAASLKVDINKINSILERYYPDRPGKQENEKYSPEFIQQVKDLWDEKRSTKAIAAALNIDLTKVNSILERYYPDRPKNKEPISTEFIQQVKDLWDKTHSAKKIAAELGLDDYTKINYILTQHYPERSGKREQQPSALVQQVKALWNRGMRSPEEFATTLNIDIKQAENILRSYYTDRPISKDEKGNLSLELIQQVKDLWDKTHSAKTIAAELGIDAIKVRSILSKYYLDRPGKQEQEPNSRRSTG